MGEQSERETPEEPDRYPNLHAVPTKRLATNIVGSLIMAKGNINRWGALMEKFLTDYRAEEDALLDLARRLAEAAEALDLKDLLLPGLPPPPIAEVQHRHNVMRERVAEARKAGLREEKP